MRTDTIDPFSTIIHLPCFACGPQAGQEATSYRNVTYRTGRCELRSFISARFLDNGKRQGRKAAKKVEHLVVSEVALGQTFPKAPTTT